MVPHRRLVMLWSMLALASPVLGQGTFFLKPKPITDPSESALGWRAMTYLMSPDEKPKVKLPAGVGKRLHYFQGSLGGKDMIAAFDTSKRQLYIDSDLDGDLSDEKPVPGKKSGSWGWGSSSYRFGPAKLQAAKTTATRPAAAGDDGAFWIEMPYYGYLQIMPATMRSGTVRIGEKSYSVGLVDANYNGHYGDLFSPKNSQASRYGGQGDCDLLAWDDNGDGSFGQSYEDNEVRPLSRLVVANKLYYSLKAAENGATVTLEQVTPKMGTLDIGTPEATLTLQSDNGVFNLAITDGKAKLPVGRYVAWRVTLTRKEGKDEWMLNGNVGESKLNDFEVLEGKTVTMKIGSPLKMVVKRETGRAGLFGGKSVNVGLTCVDDAGLSYRPGATKNGKNQPAPSIKIVDENKKIVASGQFEYG